MGYNTEIQIRHLSKDELLSEYCCPEYYEESPPPLAWRNVKESPPPIGRWNVLEACRLCPYYGKVWSCPPDLPDTLCYLEPYSQVYLVAVKVQYSDEMRKRAISQSEADRIRQESYEVEKKKLLLALLELEQNMPGRKCLGAGRCILCERCSREEGKPCRYPRKRRYSITGFGFDFTKIFKDIFGIPMLWSSEGLPEYDVAVAALFYSDSGP